MLLPFGTTGRLPGKLVPPENWHITVRFLGSLDEITTDRLLAELDQDALGGPFPVRLSGFGAFPRADKATVLWIGVESEGLVELAADVEERVQAVGIEPEERPYVPHFTLSRLRPPVAANDLIDEDWGRVVFRVDHLVLFESLSGEGGVRYRPVERFPL